MPEPSRPAVRLFLHRIMPALLFIMGAALLLPGVYLAGLGGSPYYLLAGLAVILSAILIWRRRRGGVALYFIFLLGTLLWSLWESGTYGWALLPRLGLPLAVGLVLLAARLRERAAGHRAGSTLGWAAGVLLAVLAVGVGMGIRDIAGDQSASAREASAPPLSLTAAEREWRHIGRTLGAERFSPLAQITPDNVAALEVAWTARLGMPPEGVVGALQATPLMVGDLLYTCNMHNVVLALDAENGEVRWSFDPKLDTSGIAMAVCRGVTYHRLPQVEGFCSERIYATTHDARLIALDAASGRPCPGFGDDGQVNLWEGMGEVRKGYYYLTSPPTLVRGVLVVGGSVLDNQGVDSPSGVIRGFDAVTGELIWAWDMGRPNERGLPPSGESYTQGTPNAWAPMSGDEDLGLVFVPLGNPTPDYVTTHRDEIGETYGDALVALDAETGDPVWHFQTTHRDVWDYDNPTAPTLIDFPTANGPRPALIQPTKRGQFFVLDRRTGEPLVETVERPVPQDPVPGEKLSPTQPYPVGMPAFGGERLTEAHMWGLTPFDQLWCRIQFRKARYDGEFTPIGLQPTIVYPGYLGGTNWYGVAVDPVRRLMVLNVNYFPMYNHLVPREDADADLFRPFEAGVHAYDVVHSAQMGTPYAAEVKPFLSPLGAPCHQPPFSEIAVVDLASRTVAWRQPLGTIRDSGPLGLASGLPIPMGVPALGGALVTESGLIFIAATQERTIRAFDLHKGEILWQARLPAGGHANPMSYYSDKSGRQFVVIAAGGHPLLRSRQGDYLIAYALPQP